MILSWSSYAATRSLSWVLMPMHQVLKSCRDPSFRSHRSCCMCCRCCKAGAWVCAAMRFPKRALLRRTPGAFLLGFLFGFRSSSVGLAPAARVWAALLAAALLPCSDPQASRQLLEACSCCIPLQHWACWGLGPGASVQHGPENLAFVILLSAFGISLRLFQILL